MESISPIARGKVLAEVRETLKIELRDNYAADAEDLAAWRRGDTDFLAASYAPWRDQMAAKTAAGRVLRRVRIISEPLSDYQRMAVEWSHFGTEAGEQLRWLPRHLVSAMAMPGNDCFVLDQQRVMFNIYDGSDSIVGAQVSTDAEVLKFCLDAFGLAWSLATPHEDYRP